MRKFDDLYDCVLIHIYKPYDIFSRHPISMHPTYCTNIRLFTPLKPALLFTISENSLTQIAHITLHPFICLYLNIYSNLIQGYLLSFLWSLPFRLHDISVEG